MVAGCAALALAACDGASEVDGGSCPMTDEKVARPDLSVHNCAEMAWCMRNCLGAGLEACRAACLDGPEPGRGLLDALRSCADPSCAALQGYYWDECLVEECPGEYDACLADDRTADVPCALDRAVDARGIGLPCARTSDCAACSEITCPFAIRPANPGWCTFFCGMNQSMEEAHAVCGDQAYCWIRKKTEGETGMVGSCAPVVCMR